MKLTIKRFVCTFPSRESREVTSDKNQITNHWKLWHNLNNLETVFCPLTSRKCSMDEINIDGEVSAETVTKFEAKNKSYYRNYTENCILQVMPITMSVHNFCSRRYVRLNYPLFEIAIPRVQIIVNCVSMRGWSMVGNSFFVFSWKCVDQGIFR